MGEPKAIRVMVVDDHEMVRSGLAVFLQAFDDLELVSDVGSGEEALRVMDSVRPDVVLMDLQMPGMDGIETAKAIHLSHPGTQVIALSSFCDKALVQSAMEAGALGYLMKNASIDELAKAIRAAKAGKPTLAPEALSSLIEATREKTPVEDNLTDREIEVLALIAEGLTNSEIAERLYISHATVKTHVSNILAKLDVTNRIEAATRAVQKELVPYCVREH